MYLYKNILWALSSAMILELLLENKYNSSYHQVTFWCVGRSKPIEIIFSLCAYDWVHTYFVYIDILLNTRICTQAHKENEVCVTTWTNSWYYLSGSLEVKNEKAAACCLPSGGAWGWCELWSPHAGASPPVFPGETCCWKRDCVPGEVCTAALGFNSVTGAWIGTSCFSYTEGHGRWCHLALWSMNPGLSSWQCGQRAAGADPWQALTLWARPAGPSEDDS